VWAWPATPTPDRQTDGSCGELAGGLAPPSFGAAWGTHRSAHGRRDSRCGDGGRLGDAGGVGRAPPGGGAADRAPAAAVASLDHGRRDSLSGDGDGDGRRPGASAARGPNGAACRELQRVDGAASRDGTRGSIRPPVPAARSAVKGAGDGAQAGAHPWELRSARAAPVRDVGLLRRGCLCTFPASTAGAVAPAEPCRAPGRLWPPAAKLGEHLAAESRTSPNLGWQGTQHEDLLSSCVSLSCRLRPILEINR
jgi:hypothetical protein